MPITRERMLKDMHEWEDRILTNEVYDVIEANPSPERPRWEDQRYPANGARLDSSSGRLAFDFDECGIRFANNARFSDEPVCFIAQIAHSYKEGSVIYPHIHWIQESDNVPNVLMQYRWYNNGEAPPAWKEVIGGDTIFPYVQDQLQIQRLDIDPTDAVGKRISSFVDVRLFRDSANTSGLFSGTDSYPDGWLLKEFDIHIEMDSNGSSTELSK